MHGWTCWWWKTIAEAGEMMTMVLADRGARVRMAGDYDSALARVGMGLARRAGQRHRPAGPRRLRTDAPRAFHGRAGVSEPPPAGHRADGVRGPEDREKTLDAGFDLHLSKPLKPHALVTAIQAIRTTRKFAQSSTRS